MALNKNKTINLGILAHVDAGKTTITEQLLYKYGNLRTLGSVDKGNTQTDFLEIERRRGISVAAAAVSIAYNDCKINIIDTPGHMDFTGEVERVLSALDGVVLVVSSLEGIQSQTEKFFKALVEMGIPTIIFVNKIDRMGANPGEILNSLHREFSAKIIPINDYVDPGEKNASTQPLEVFAEDSILELCEADETLAEIYLETGQAPKEKLLEVLGKETAAANFYPLIYGTAISAIGIDTLMEAVQDFLPTPAVEADLSGIIYKIEHDKTLGKMAHVRLFGGQIKTREEIQIHRPSLVEDGTFIEKTTQIRSLSGTKREDIPMAMAGDIAAICGLTNARAGDIIGELLQKKYSPIATPLFTVKVFGPKGKEMELLTAIRQLCDEDPLMDYVYSQETKELVIKIMGKIQVEILEFLILERYGLAVEFSAPSVIYKETVLNSAIGHESYTMPKPCWAILTLQVDPLPLGAGFKYKSAAHKSVLDIRYQNHIEIAVKKALSQGRLGWECTDMEITLLSGESHIYHTHPMDFFLATPIAFMRAISAGTPTLLEPLNRLRLTTTEDLAGTLIGDIIKMRGEFDSPVIKNGKLEMEAIIPVATSQDYPTRFSSLTSGKGLIKADFYGHKPCTLDMGQTAQRREVDPLDRDKWILYKRGAL